MSVRIQTNGFDLSAEVNQICSQHSQVGAVVSFTGLVREGGVRGEITHLEIEFYPGMTEKSMQDLEKQARDRWSIIDVLMIHRVGRLAVGENIVGVLVLSEHRRDAFLAAEFLMDALKSTVPFWKKEIYRSGENWVEAKSSDRDAYTRWHS